MPAVQDQRIEFTSLRETDYWSIQVAVDQKVIKLVRKAEPLTSVEDVTSSFEEIRDVVGKFPLVSWGLVFDMRDARPVDSPEIENAFRENRKRIYGAFQRQAVLLKTAAGVMQVRRMLAKAPDQKIGVFSDEAEAYAWARGEGDPG